MHCVIRRSRCEASLTPLIEREMLVRYAPASTPPRRSVERSTTTGRRVSPGGSAKRGRSSWRRSTTAAATRRRWPTWPPLAAVSGGETHTLALDWHGALCVWAATPTASSASAIRPRGATPRSRGDAGWAAVSGGDYYSLALKTDGTLWACGNNRDGELGLGDTVARDVFTQVGAATDWMATAAGYGHTVALKQDGTLWAWAGTATASSALVTRADDGSDHAGRSREWLAVSAATTSAPASRPTAASGPGLERQRPARLGGGGDRHTPTRIAVTRLGERHLWRVPRPGAQGRRQPLGLGWNGNGQLGLVTCATGSGRPA